MDRLDVTPLTLRAMRWLDVGTETCSIQRALDVVGDRWTVLVLREVFNGVRRFDPMRRHLGVSDPVLAARLRKLVEAGVLETVPYREPGSRTRHEYRLTAKGADLYPVLLALMEWGDRHCAEPEGPSVTVRHRGCGEPVGARVTCAAGHTLAHPREAEASPGPAARRGAGPTDP